ncbi:ABC transporter permease [Anaerorhabdus sp.]|uniref:ABC transporter permease n=1 Tax=Anaerorhabdus sp. TaxID=1872524 RepID=UPI002FC75FFD
MKSIYLAKQGILGRKKENFILVSMIILSIIFLISYLVYNQSSLRSLEESRRNLYGEWYSTTYNVDKPIANVDGISSIIEQNALIYDNNMILGSIGKVDQQFEKLSRVHLLSGVYPTNENEIALSTSVLDSLGFSYDLGSVVKIPYLPNNFDMLKLQQPIIETEYIEYKLVGILPAYDVFWQKNNEVPLVNAIVFDFKEGYPTKYQILWKGSDEFDTYKLVSQQSKDVVINEFAYPKQDGFNTSLLLIEGGVIGLAFISNLIIYSLLLNKRKRSFLTMSNLGATKAMIVKVVFIESILILTFSFIIGIPIGFIVGVLISLSSLNIVLSIPWIQISYLLILLYGVSFVSFLLSSLMLKVDNPDTLRNEKVKKINKVSIASKNKISVIVLTLIILFVSIGTLYLSRWSMMAYDKNAPYAALNIQSKSEGFFDEKIISDLNQIPEVKEVAAYNYIPMEYFVTSQEIRESKTFNDLYDSTIEPKPVHFYKRGILSTHFFVLSDSESDVLIELSNMNAEDIERFKKGEGVIYYQMQLIKDIDSNMVYDSSVEGNIKGYELLESPVYRGSMLALSNNQFVNEEGHDYTIPNVFENELEVLGIVTGLNDKLLIGNNTPISNGDIFVSQAFNKKLMQRMEERVVHTDEYSNINVTIDKNSSYSTRKSIASIVTSRGGLLQSDSYEIVEQLYRECSQKSLIIILSGSLVVLFSMVLLWNIVSSSLLMERRRIGILQALGVSNKKLCLSYIKKISMMIIPISVIVNGLIVVVMNFINQPKYLMDFTKIFVYGNYIYFDYPILMQVALNGILILVLALIQIYPLYKMIKDQPIHNMKDYGGI